MNKRLIIGVLVIILCMCLVGCQKTIKKTEGVEVVATLDDKITKDSTWCAPFQLVWNDMQNTLTDGEVKMNPQPEVVDNLNKQTFKEDMISDEYIYKKFAEASPELKEEIIKGLKEKFNQTSDILDQIDFSKSEDLEIKKYIFHAMLYREFTYKNKFDELKKGRFKGSNPTDVEFFGISEDSKNKDKLLSQLEAYYYNDADDFAIKIATKEGDEVVLVKKPSGESFGEIWNNVIEKSKDTKADERVLDSSDEFKMPKLSFNVTKEFNEIENKKFKTKDGNNGKIEKAIQSVMFEIDAMGGRVKSESFISMFAGSVSIRGRFFYLDDTFAIFLKEKDKDVPYFAALVDDITKY